MFNSSKIHLMRSKSKVQEYMIKKFVLKLYFVDLTMRPLKIQIIKIYNVVVCFFGNKKLQKDQNTLTISI